MLALRRKRLALAALCVVAVALGTGAGNAARKGLALSIPSAPTPPRPAPPAEAPPSNLATRIESAKDGDILDIPTGRHLIPPIHLHGRRLTLRGAPGPRPVLVRAHQHTWDSLIQSDRDLTLEHLDLEAGDANGPPAPLVSVESATLTLRDCALTQRSAAPALTLRRGPLLLLERCRITALEQTLAVEAPSSADGRVSLRECDLHVRDSNGAAILLWGTDAAPARPLAVELVASKLRAGRLVACRSLASLVDLSADDNQLIFHHALVCLHGCRDRLRWRGQRNRCESSGPWAWLDGRPQAARDEAAFAALWSSSR